MASVPDVVISLKCAYVERFELPGPGRVVANVGAAVTPADVVGYVVERGAVRVVDVAGALRVPRRAVGEHLAIKEGQSVREGEPLAQRRSALGTRAVRAPVSARAMVVGAGLVLLEEFPSERPVRGCIPGRVTEVIAGEALVVQGTGALLLATTLIGAGFSGPLKVAAPVPERVLREEHIDATCHGTVIVGGIGGDLQALKRAAGFGAQGAVLGSVPASWARADLPIPVAVTESFGHVPMNRAAFDALNGLAGAPLHVLRRGGRAWLISPAATPADGGACFDGAGLGPVEVGAAVRVIAGTRAGAIGEVLALVPGSGEVTLKLGRETPSLPLSNVERLVR